MKVIFMGRKPAASEALRHLVGRGAEVVAVVAPGPPAQHPKRTFWRPLLRDTARELGIPVVSDTEIYEALAAPEEASIDLSGVDLVISFLFWKKIRPELIALPRIGCFNFHPGPLPEFRAMRGYNFAIVEGHTEYGASVHWVAPGFDTGDIVLTRRLAIRRHETAFSLEQRTMVLMGEMFQDFIDDCLSGRPIAQVPQGQGGTATKREMLELSRVRPDDAPDVIERKVRGFWYPPHQGATIELGGKTYTLVDDATLEALGAFLHGSRKLPY